MVIVDLTSPYQGRHSQPQTIVEEVPLRSASTSYTGLIYHLTSDSMQGTYLDLPGHIKETDDGRRTYNIPAEEIYRRPATVLRLARPSLPGAVTGDDLQQALGTRTCQPTIIINALGEKNTFAVEPRTVFLDDSAVQWIIRQNCKMLISDIYESKALHGVFLQLFQAGIATVCEPCNLAMLTAPEVLITILFPLWPGLTQIPCRLLAEWN